MSDILIKAIQDEVRLRLLEESIPRIKQCLVELSIEQIWHRPNDNSNAVGNLVLHLCGNVRQYLISSIGSKVDTRERQKEFDARDISKDALLKEIEILAIEIEQAIPFITNQELERQRSVQGFEMTGLSIVVHVIEHFSYHTGQIAYFTKMVKDMDLKFYGDLDLDVVG